MQLGIAHPAVGFVGPLEAFGCYCVGEYEESGATAADRVQAFNQQIVLVVEHESQAFPGDIPAGLSVNLIAEFHVVG